MLRDRLWAGLSEIEEVYLNGDMDRRVPHNLNVSFNYVEGESLIMAVKELAVSSGSACTSASLEPSYAYWRAGRNDELAHSSIRFTIGRFTTEQEIDFTVDLLKKRVGKLRDMSPLWEMAKEGVDLNSVQWAAHRQANLQARAPRARTHSNCLRLAGRNIMAYSEKVLDHYEKPPQRGVVRKSVTIPSVPAWSARRPVAT